MNSAIFKAAPLVERSFFQKLFKQHPVANAVIEVNNLLSTIPVQRIFKADITAIEQKYRLKLRKEFALNIEEFYAVYLKTCFDDQHLSEEECKDLQHLKHLFSLDNKTIEKLHAMVGEVIYQQSFEEVVADGRLTEQEQAFLLRLQSDLRLPQALADKIAAETQIAFVQNFIEEAISDERLSPEEEAEIDTLAKNLNYNITMDQLLKSKLQRLRLYWALENTSLIEIEVVINLQKKEQCYFITDNVQWHEPRSTRGKTIQNNQWKLIDKGTVYVTNKRLIFSGEEKNSAIRLEKILYLTEDKEGIVIEKDAGKSPLLVFKDKADIFKIILERLIREL